MHILISILIGAFLMFISANICGILGGDTLMGIFFVEGIIVCMIIYMLMYIKDQNKKLFDGIEQVREMLKKNDSKNEQEKSPPSDKEI